MTLKLILPSLVFLFSGAHGFSQGQATGRKLSLSSAAATSATNSVGTGVLTAPSNNFPPQAQVYSTLTYSKGNFKYPNVDVVFHIESIDVGYRQAYTDLFSLGITGSYGQQDVDSTITFDDFSDYNSSSEGKATKSVIGITPGLNLGSVNIGLSANFNDQKSESESKSIASGTKKSTDSYSYFDYKFGIGWNAAPILRLALNYSPSVVQWYTTKETNESSTGAITKSKDKSAEVVGEVFTLGANIAASTTTNIYLGLDRELPLSKNKRVTQDDGTSDTVTEESEGYTSVSLATENKINEKLVARGAFERQSTPESLNNTLSGGADYRLLKSLTISSDIGYAWDIRAKKHGDNTNFFIASISAGASF